MLQTHAGLTSLLVIVTIALGACATGQSSQETKGPFEELKQIYHHDKDGRRYRVLESKRFISGPYGTKEAIQQLKDTIIEAGVANEISNRALDLPNKPANLSLTKYEYTTPAICGEQQFYVYTGKDLQILQYNLQEGSRTTKIRDYLTGPTPFVEAGLWGPYDHTDDTALELCLLPGSGSKDNMGLMESNYEIGWITNITDWRQAELGQKYAAAVKDANQCLQQIALGKVSTKPASSTIQSYTVEANDTLSGIAQQAYGDSGRWADIYRVNKDVIGGNPNSLRSGITLKLP